MGLERIISGGQTGVDRGALDAALRLGVPCGGWCPRSRKSENGPIPARYPLVPLDSDDYPARTRANVEEADGTLILASGPLRGGTALTLRLARRSGRACLVVDPSQEEAVDEVREWLCDHAIAVLNVAGPRESQQPGIERTAEAFLAELLSVGRDDGDDEIDRR